MSRRPKCPAACWTAAKSAARSVTSSSIGRVDSPYWDTRSSSVEVSRAVAATWSPRSRAAMAHSRPKPRELPVMNQVLEDVMSTTLGLRVRSKSKRQPVAALGGQVDRRREPPRLEAELGELLAVDALEVDDHPPVAAGGELDLEDLRPLPHQRGLLGQRLLEPDRAGQRPQVAEGAPGHLELVVAAVVGDPHLLELGDQLLEVLDRAHSWAHSWGTTTATHSTWWVIGNRSKARSASSR